MIDSLCKEFEEYAQAKDKKTGDPTIIRFDLIYYIIIEWLRTTVEEIRVDEMLVELSRDKILEWFFVNNCWFIKNSW